LYTKELTEILNKILTCCLFFIFIDRSEGGGSIQDGSVEVMIHRRTLYDDALGVGEPLNETAFGEGLVVRGKHYLIVETPAESAAYHRIGSQRLFMRPLATFALPAMPYANYSAAYRQTWSALTDTLPDNVHLLTLDQLSAKEFLVRVEHFFELNEDATYSHPVTFDLQSLFKSIGTISTSVEMALGGNLALADMHRLDWLTGNEKLSQTNIPSEFLK
jgi:lysosomal alpha-mannosidase